ncbi:MAG TPA: hypothetical protein VN723_08210 [Rhizomicrobium sp.]|jgi:hypothetical protein|nr:hypothetical protein [Rhizomicrobium sp.]
MPDHPRPLRKWLRLTGFTLGGLVAILLVLAAVGFGLSLLDEMRLREDSRTHEGSLEGNGAVRGHANRLLARLPPRSTLGDNAFRFVAVPELSYYTYVVSLSAKGATVEGVLITTERSRDEKKTTTTEQNFTMPRNDYHALVTEMDHLADHFGGDDSMGCLDGTMIGFERIRGARVTSGIGNGGCSKHYAAIGEIVRLTLMRFVTPRGSPLGHGWYPGF